jgi:hypothetical protein
VEILINHDAIDPIRDHDVPGHVHACESMYQGITTTCRYLLHRIYTIIIHLVCTILYGIVYDQEIITQDQTCVNDNDNTRTNQL